MVYGRKRLNVQRSRGGTKYWSLSLSEISSVLNLSLGGEGKS